MKNSQNQIVVGSVCLSKRSVWLFGLVLMVSLYLLGCAGGMPKVPDTPEAVLAKADEYYEKNKFYQAQELYKAFISRYPGHDQSDYAQFMLAESYLGNREYPLAAVEYQILLSNYGYSEYVDDALFKIGLCYFYESPKPERDQQKAVDALSRFNQFLQTFPNSPLIPEVEDYIKQLNIKLAEKDFKNGYYYFRRKKLTAAMIYFDKVITNYPGNSFWAQSAYFKALILEDRGRDDEAIRHYVMVLTYPEDVSFKTEARLRMNKLQE